MVAATPAVYTIPINRGFADALADGLLARTRGDTLDLARAIVLLPNNRARRAVMDGFVRRSEGGLLLPRLVSIGDPALDERIGPLFDPADEGEVPPAIDPLRRQLILARLVGETRPGTSPVEAVRLAADLARTLDQMIVEGVHPARLADAVPEALASHWQTSLQMLRVILARWPEELARLGLIDLADRRNRLLEAAERRWAERPPASLIVAAGITAAGPAVARLLRRIARLPRGTVVLAGLDRFMPAEEWDALAGGEGQRPIETHPQFALRQLLDAMGVARSEVRLWRHGRDAAAPAVARAIGNAMAPAAFTDKWQALPARYRRLSGARAATFPTAAAEAQAIAIALRQAVEQPGRTAALVTPDRMLARRVATLLRRWGIEADDSAGQPLSRTPAGTLLGAIADAAAERFAPVPLLALLKHPLVRAGEGRLAWLDQVRKIDRALRGPRPAPGLAGIAKRLAEAGDRAMLDNWETETGVLTELAGLTESGEADLVTMLEQMAAVAQALAGDEAWSRPAGRAAAELIAGLRAGAADGPATIAPEAFPALLRAFTDMVAVRPPQGGHPRVFIWGLIEARLQRTDLTILGGLNEGVWPGLPAPDPWLAPAIRSALGLPGLERRIGSEAEQFAAALGGGDVLLTRARRDARAPTIASRFWLRLQAMTGGLPPDRALAEWADAIDRPERPILIDRPAPSPSVADRPRRIAVTKLDRLQADPFAFYADAMLKLRAWERVDADPSAAWRGSAVHRVFEAWIKEDDCDPARLRPRAARLLDEAGVHPVLRALWTPRLLEAIDWVAGEMAADLAQGRRPIAAERKGAIDIAGIRLEGTADRIDRLADQSLAIVDWKTGKPPSKRAVAEGYSMQLGLLGLIAERGGFSEIAGVPGTFEYWSLAASKGQLGYRASPVGLNKAGEGIAPDDFTTRAARILTQAVDRYLLGAAPFTAKLHPEYAPYGDYDQLMRLDEWYGRVAERGEA